MTVYFRACGDITIAPSPRSDRDVALREELERRTGLTISIDPAVDYEDWTEPASMLAEALAAELEVVILPRCDLRRAVANPIATISGAACRDILIGRTLESDMRNAAYFDLGWPLAKAEQANHYAELAAFWAHAGRRIALADMPGDRESACRSPVFAKGHEALELGEAMKKAGPGEILVKQVYPAKILPLLSYDIETSFAPEDGKDMFFDDVGHHFARFEGDPAALLVQQKITMTHETRFFVIGGEIITAAACIEAHTPMQERATEGRALLEPVWEIGRNSGEMDTRPLEARQETAQKLWAFAAEVCKGIAREAPQLDAYVMDLALDGSGNPLVIELNPAPQSGMYNIDARALFQAILAYAEKAPHRTPLAWRREDLAQAAQTPSASPRALLLAKLSARAQMLQAGDEDDQAEGQQDDVLVFDEDKVD